MWFELLFPLNAQIADMLGQGAGNSTDDECPLLYGTQLQPYWIIMVNTVVLWLLNFLFALARERLRNCCYRDCCAPLASCKLKHCGDACLCRCDYEALSGQALLRRPYRIDFGSQTLCFRLTQCSPCCNALDTSRTSCF